MDTTTPAHFCSEYSYPGSYEISYSLSHSDSRSHMHTHTQALAQQSSGARLLWLKIRGGIINHKSLPLVKSGLSWCERSAVPAEQRQALAGWRARGACRGFPRHPEAYQSCGRWMDGRTMIRTRLWLRIRPTGTHLPLVTDSSLLQSTLQRNEKQLEGWRAHCSNHICSLQTRPQKEDWLPASTSWMAELWRLMI